MSGDSGRRAWKWLILAAVAVLLVIADVQVVNGFGGGQKMKCDSIVVSGDGKGHRVCP